MQYKTFLWPPLASRKQWALVPLTPGETPSVTSWAPNVYWPQHENHWPRCRWPRYNLFLRCRRHPRRQILCLRHTLCLKWTNLEMKLRDDLGHSSFLLQIKVSIISQITHKQKGSSEDERLCGDNESCAPTPNIIFFLQPITLMKRNA